MPGAADRTKILPRQGKARAVGRDWNPPVALANSLSPRRGEGVLTLNKLTGWWHGVTTGDLDGDGRLDIVVSNWGKNSKYAASMQRPWRLYYGDLNGAGEVNLVEARWDSLMQKEVPERGWRMVRAALPFLQEKVSSYEAYGKASVQEIYGERLKSLQVVEVNTTATIVLWGSKAAP